MDTLSIANVAFHGRLHPRSMFIHTLHPTTFVFTFGQAYLLDTLQSPSAGEALCWLIAGVRQPDQGIITRNDRLYPQQARSRDTWRIRSSTVRIHRLALREPSIQAQIRYGLARQHGRPILSEQAIITHFGLTATRYTRPLRQLSSEAWRASCAVGLANSKTIFCFPYLEASYLGYYPWFRQLIALLTGGGALVLLPTQATPTTAGLCDVIVPID